MTLVILSLIGLQVFGIAMLLYIIIIQMDRGPKR